MQWHEPLGKVAPAVASRRLQVIVVPTVSPTKACSPSVQSSQDLVMSSSNLYKRPVWLKGKSAAGPKPEPTQSPHSTDLDMFSRASQYTPQQDRDQSSAKRRRISDDRTPSLTPYDNRSEARGSKSRSPRGPSAARAAEAAKSARRESSNGASAARAAKAARKEALAADIEHGDAVGQGSPPSIR